MDRATIFKGALVAVCLTSMLVLPSAAAQNGRGMNGKSPAAATDPGLKENLWNSRMQYRLQVFDMHVQHAQDVIGILPTYNIDTMRMQGALFMFSGRKRTELRTALQNRNREARKAINAELTTVGDQFLKEMRDAIRDH